MAARKKGNTIPKPLYEALPALYVIGGILATSIAIPSKSLLMFVSGAILLVVAAVIIEMRATYRGQYVFIRRDARG